MSMTREEIIREYEGAVVSSGLAAAAGNEGEARNYEILKAGLEALRAPTRERMKKMRGEWMGSADGYADGELVYDIWECSHCGYVIDEEDDPDMLPQFCPKCCSIMADEAVEMVMERLEALKDEKR